MKICYSIIIVLVLTGCATTRTEFSRAALNGTLDERYRFPSEISTFENTGVTNYEKKFEGGGLGASYVAKGLGKIDLYFYDFGFDSIPEETESEIIVDQMILAANEVRLFADSRGNTEVTIQDAQKITIGNYDLWECKIRNYVYGDSVFDSFILITGYKNVIFKARISFLKDIRAEEIGLYQKILEVIGKEYFGLNQSLVLTRLAGARLATQL
jgi:hypothetical protein